MSDSPFVALLPERCSVKQADEPQWWSGGLYAEERWHAQKMHALRRREFTAGRNCARAALRSLGLPDVVIGKGAQGEPLFPCAVTGSITHTGDYCAAAVCRKLGISSIGIDAQQNVDLDQSLYRRVLGHRPGTTIASDGHCEGTLVFSLKEAFYKALYPVCQRPVPAMALKVHLPASFRPCIIEVLTPALKTVVEAFNVDIRFSFDEQRIYSAVTLSERS